MIDFANQDTERYESALCVSAVNHRFGSSIKKEGHVTQSGNRR
jgi:hypothetical protein